MKYSVTRIFKQHNDTIRLRHMPDHAQEAVDVVDRK
jgi:hypothetical protein